MNSAFSKLKENVLFDNISTNQSNKQPLVFLTVGSGLEGNSFLLPYFQSKGKVRLLTEYNVVYSRNG